MIKTYLDIYTAHLTRATMDLLENIAAPASFAADKIHANDWPAMSVAVYEFGVFITVPEKIEGCHNLPDDLRDVLLFAQSQGVGMVRFDAHSDGIEDLKSYDW
jgi:hypothetical protein